MGAGRGTETHDENARERSHTRSQRPDRRLLAAPTYRTSCGANRDRTGDLLNAIQALSQLSYSPGPFCGRPWEGCRTDGGS